MHLLDTRNLELSTFNDSDLPKYAILSHTWGPPDEELLYRDITQSPRSAWEKKKRFNKVEKSCKEALELGFDWIWIDTVCIDKSSSAELSEAINSMFNWYSRAKLCISYLEDANNVHEMSHSRWFARGWTLQELIAPPNLRFYGAAWNFLGTRKDLVSIIEGITGIERICLARRRWGPDGLRSHLDTFTVSQRMVWARGRQTTRLEDRAYSLMGIFGVNMPLVYGEGARAFIRLQEEIIKTTNDNSILAHTGRGWAKDPDSFVGVFRHSDNDETTAISSDSVGIKLKLSVCPCTYLDRPFSLGILDGTLPEDRVSRVAVLLENVHGSTWRRFENDLWRIAPYQAGSFMPYQSETDKFTLFKSDDDEQRRLQADLGNTHRESALILHRTTASFSQAPELSVTCKVTQVAGNESYEIEGSYPAIKNNLMVGKPLIGIKKWMTPGTGVDKNPNGPWIGAICFRDIQGGRSLLVFGITSASGVPWCNFTRSFMIGEHVGARGSHPGSGGSPDFSRLDPNEFQPKPHQETNTDFVVFGASPTRLKASIARTEFLGTETFELSIFSSSSKEDYDSLVQQTIAVGRSRRRSDTPRAPPHVPRSSSLPQVRTEEEERMHREEKREQRRRERMQREPVSSVQSDSSQIQIQIRRPRRKNTESRAEDSPSVSVVL